MVVVGGAVVVVLGGQGFGVQVAHPAGIPFCAVHSLVLPTRVQVSKAPVGDDCTQHATGTAIIVVVVVVAVMVVVGRGAVVVLVDVVVVVSACVVVVVVGGAIVVVVLGGQGFGVQLADPEGMPLCAAHSLVPLTEMQVSKAPVADDCTQHPRAPGIVVVVADGTVVVVLVGRPHEPHASQQLGAAPTHAVPPGGALHAAALRLMLHLAVPLASVRQQVTKFFLPQTECAAHCTSSSRQACRSEPSRTAAVATWATQLT